MIKNYLLPAAYLVCAPLLSADTLGEAISQSEEQSSEKALCSVMNGKVHCQICRIELTRSLYLPDAAFSGETYHAPKNHVLLVIIGTARNTGRTPVDFQIPEFSSQSGKTYEEEDSIRFSTSKNDMFSTSLNPGAEHRFICFYSLPVREILGGKLIFEKELFSFSDNTTLLPLPINNGTQIKEFLNLPGVTDF
ncbi:MAG: hypothetical protein IJB33_04420 [Akkermansia sp.]|nr:hypothetical protein [Akkermansia sp.]